ncbi:MAG: hypothetical protein WC236_13705 [Gallionellaceae bacterium]|jgi:seryl-tRNA synthetase
MNNEAPSKVCEHCNGTGNELANSACEGFVTCSECGGKAPSNEQEVFDIARIVGMNFRASELLEFASKLRAKDAATIATKDKYADYLNRSVTNLSDEVLALNKTIAQLKEEVKAYKLVLDLCVAEFGEIPYGDIVGYIEELKQLVDVRGKKEFQMLAELTESQEQVKMLREVLHSCVMAGEDEDDNKWYKAMDDAVQALSATASPVSPDTKEG